MDTTTPKRHMILAPFYFPYYFIMQRENLVNSRCIIPLIIWYRFFLIGFNPNHYGLVLVSFIFFT